MAATANIPTATDRFERSFSNGWSIVSKTEAQRPLEGAELLVNYSEYYNQGDFQLTVAFPFKTNIDAATLEKRLPTAVWRARTWLPELGTSTVSFGSHPSTTASSALTRTDVDLDHATFKAIKSFDQALEWLDESVFIVHGARSYQEVHRLLHQLQIILQSLFNPDFDQLLSTRSDESSGGTAHDQVELVKAVFKPEDLKHVLPRLAQSLPHAYKSRFQPGVEDRDYGDQKQAERLENETKSTIGISGFNRVLEGLSDGDRPIVNLRHSFTRREQESFRIQCKRNKATVSSYVYAAIIKSIQQVNAAVDISGRSKLAQGAHLTFPAHASRWLPKETAKHAQSIVAMAIAPASVYLRPEEVSPSDGSANDANAQDAQLQDTFRLARILGAKQNEHLRSPHIMGYLEALGQAGAQGIRSNVEALANGDDEQADELEDGASAVEEGLDGDKHPHGTYTGRPVRDLLHSMPRTR